MTKGTQTKKKIKMPRNYIATKIVFISLIVVMGYILNDLALKRTVDCQVMANVFTVIIVGTSLITALLLILKNDMWGAWAVFLPSVIYVFMWRIYFYRLDIGLLITLLFLTVLIDWAASKILELIKKRLHDVEHEV